MIETVDSKKFTITAKSCILPPNRFEVAEGKSIILAADIPHGTEPAGWALDGNFVNTEASAKELPRFRAFERLVNGESPVDYDCFLSRQMPNGSHRHAPSTIRAYLAIDSTCPQDTGSYELFIRTKSNPSTPIACAVANIRVLPAKDNAGASKKRKTSGGVLSSELPSVHYPHPMAPVFIRSLPDKIYVDAGDTVQLGCRLWGLPNNFVNWTSEAPINLMGKASVAS